MKDYDDNALSITLRTLYQSNHNEVVSINSPFGGRRRKLSQTRTNLFIEIINFASFGILTEASSVVNFWTRWSDFDNLWNEVRHCMWSSKSFLFSRFLNDIQLSTARFIDFIDFMLISFTIIGLGWWLKWLHASFRSPHFICNTSNEMIIKLTRTM